MRTKILIIALLFIPFLKSTCKATVKVHSHNDYKQSRPFYNAYEAECNSVEADIYFINGDFYVGHDKNELTPKATLRNLYLNPIYEAFKQNNGTVYKNGNGLQLLIELKEKDSLELPALERQLREYGTLFDGQQHKGCVTIVITGCVPEPKNFAKYSKIFYFDGLPDINYTKEQMKRVPMISVEFSKYSHWQGKGKMLKKEQKRIKDLAQQLHKKGQTLRFWGCPDNSTAWKLFIKLGIDWLNTDHPAIIRKFLKTY